jgi:hypothetical protein
MPLFSDRVNLKPVCFLLCFGHVASAAALGLGEIAVHSSLGQPLHATVPLLDALASTTAECFSLGTSPGSISPPLRAQLSIEQIGARTLLHIRTPQSVLDPVSQFVLVSDCEARLQREYIVLLDPPGQVETTIAHDQAASTQTTATPRSITTPRASRPPRAKRIAPVAARPQRETASPSMKTAKSSAPRLVLSGKRHPVSNAGLSLRLDTNLPDLTLPRPEKLTATELSDENTALNHKLAHLETQLLALQQRNAQLEAQRKTGTPAAVPPPAPHPMQPAQWPVYLLAIGLLGASGLLIAWLRMRSRNDRTPLPISDDLLWTQPPASSLAETAQTSKHEQAHEPVPDLEFERMAEIAQPLHEEGTEVKEDILDQAEVFMAHGHGELAIHLLQEHLREAPNESPIPWLLLLDLLHRAGDAAGYSAASTECRRYFNVNVSSLPASQPEDGLGLEAYPHLLERLTTEWRSPNIDAFFNELIYDDRGGTRIGFEPGAYRDIVMLQAIARQALPIAA